jgi:cytochrome c556
MIKNIVLVLALCIFANSAANADEETREYVEFPLKLQLKMMENMRDHMAALNEILEYIAFDDLDKAAEVAENRLGLSARHSHGTAGLAQYMTQGMKQAGYNMHSAASRFAQVAKEGDTESALETLTEVTSSCVACHAAYRIR